MYTGLADADAITLFYRVDHHVISVDSNSLFDGSNVDLKFVNQFILATPFSYSSTRVNESPFTTVMYSQYWTVMHALQTHPAAT